MGNLHLILFHSNIVKGRASARFGFLAEGFGLNPCLSIHKSLFEHTSKQGVCAYIAFFNLNLPGNQ